MKVMFLIRSLGHGGAERQLVNLAKGLRGLGHDVAVVTFYPGKPLENDLSDACIPVWTLDKGGRWDIARSAWRLVRLVQEARPAILHGYLSTANLLTVIAKLFCPSIKVVWGVRASNVDLHAYDWPIALSYRWECLLSKFADLIIANSYAGRKHYLAQGFPAKKMIVIHNGIDINRFKSDEQAGRRVRWEWGIKDGEKLVGLVARLDPMKDHATFVKAAALVAQQRKDVRFVCVGEGPDQYREGLYSLANELGLGNRLIWAGSREDMPAVYNAFDIAVSSSAWGEGFPNVLGEALACGVPCVATNVGDSAIILAASGGEIVAASDPRALARGIEALLDSDAQYSPSTFHKRRSDNLDQKRMVIATEQVLSGLVCR